MSDLPPIEYLAGILDANAIFRVRKTPGGTELPAVFVHGLPMPIMEVLAEATGTKVTVVNRDYPRAPCSLHCEEQHVHVTSVSGRWSVTGAKATVLIAAVLPSLRVQKEQAAEVLDVGLAAPRKTTTFSKMATLGWPTPAVPQDTLRLVQ
jgi:hypothetical protein